MHSAASSIVYFVKSSDITLKLFLKMDMFALLNENHIARFKK